METSEEIEVLLEGLDEDNITSILTKWNEVTTVKKKLAEAEEMLKVKIKNYLKERQWDRYMDQQTQISVSISTQKRDSIDKQQLKTILSDAQLAQIMRTTSFEKMSIITPETRKRLKNFVKK